MQVGSCSKTGKALVKIDPKYFRPTEVELLIGDPTKAKEKLGWVPKTTMEVRARAAVLAQPRSRSRARAAAARTSMFHACARAWRSGDLALAVSLAAGADQPNAVKVGAVAGAMGLHSTLAWSRGQILSFLAEFDLERFVARLETGGAIALLLAMLLAPYVATAFLALATLTLLATALGIRAIQRAADRACRVPCAKCDHPVRPEARRCPNCGTAP